MAPERSSPSGRGRASSPTRYARPSRSSQARWRSFALAASATKRFAGCSKRSSRPRAGREAMVAEQLVIETADLRKNYDGVEALRGLTLRVPPGSIYGFMGRNGAGKTTTIKILLGMAFPTSGEARV